MLRAEPIVAASRCLEKTAAVGPQSKRRWRAGQLADLAVGALIAEASLTPKPALVDGRGSGAHQDLNLETLLRSAHSLRAGFFAMARVAPGREVDGDLRQQLARIGRDAEVRMLQVTQGANAHRGAIWVLGLLVAARAMSAANAEPGEVAALAGRIAELPDRHAPDVTSNGARVCERYGVRGARGEAAAGFPHVIHLGLPALHAARRRGADDSCARLDALMAIMSSLDDTCLLHRGGRAALAVAQRGARAVLKAGGASSSDGRRRIFELDTQLLALNASPGGCADLLAACIFLDG
jgi:triphosphoribosyl-dephospho-CoA synthase